MNKEEEEEERRRGEREWKKWVLSNLDVHVHFIVAV